MTDFVEGLVMTENCGQKDLSIRNHMLSWLRHCPSSTISGLIPTIAALAMIAARTFGNASLNTAICCALGRRTSVCWSASVNHPARKSPIRAAFYFAKACKGTDQTMSAEVWQLAMPSQSLLQIVDAGE